MTNKAERRELVTALVIAAAECGHELKKARADGFEALAWSVGGFRRALMALADAFEKQDEDDGEDQAE